MIEINELQFSYGKHQVFDNVSMQLESGKIYGLLGQNGVGKTTLLKVIAGLLKLKKGSCTVNDSIPFKREPAFLESIYFLPEDFIGPDTTVEKYASTVGPFYPKFDQERFYRLLAEFEINPKAKFTKLSFGQQKKGIISLALALNTDVLIMDEPSNGLDIPSKVLLRRMISENVSDNQTILISTHQVRDVENLIDPIIILDKHGVLLNESVEEIAKKLEFSVLPQKDTDALYSEAALNGYLTVKENTTGYENQIDIEALFNCTLANKDAIRKIFNK